MFKKKNKTDKLDEVIDDILSTMPTYSPDSPEFAKMADQVIKLITLQTAKKSEGVSKDTMATVAAHLAGILLIVGYERANVMTSKAVGFVQKLR